MAALIPIACNRPGFLARSSDGKYKAELIWQILPDSYVQEMISLSGFSFTLFALQLSHFPPSHLRFSKSCDSGWCKHYDGYEKGK
jgi:hypothetical protein